MSPRWLLWRGSTAVYNNICFQSTLKAEQLRQQFSRAEAERNDLSRKLEEAQGKFDDSESVRKKLQNRLESLNRQMEEGEGDRERLVEQLETLRGQVRILWIYPARAN